MGNSLTRAIFKLCPPLERSWRKQSDQIDVSIGETEKALEEEKARGQAAASEADRVINTLNNGNQP